MRNIPIDLTREARANQLYALYTEAKRLVEDLSRSLNFIAPNSQQLTGNPADSSQCDQAAVQTTVASSLTAGSPGQLMLNTGSLLSSALFEVGIVIFIGSGGSSVCLVQLPPPLPPHLTAVAVQFGPPIVAAAKRAEIEH